MMTSQSEQHGFTTKDKHGGNDYTSFNSGKVSSDDENRRGLELEETKNQEGILLCLLLFYYFRPFHHHPHHHYKQHHHYHRQYHRHNYCHRRSINFK